MKRHLVVAIAFSLGFAGPGRAQWRSQIRPTSQGTRNTGLVGGLRAEFWLPADSGTRDAVAVMTEAGVGIRGSWQIVGSIELANRWPGWRLAARVSGQRDATFEYFGLGNDTRSDRAGIPGAGDDYFRVVRRRYSGRIAVGHRVVGPVAVAGWLGGVEAAFQAPGGPSRFESDHGRFQRSTDFQVGALVVIDSRDKVGDPSRGWFVESGIAAGTANRGYRRWITVARAYLPVAPGTIVAARVGGAARLSGTLPLDARFVLPLLEGDIGILGGRDTFRGLQYQRLAGDGVLWANLDVRQHLTRFRGREIRVLGFADAGRGFENEPFRLGLRGLKFGWGAGLALPTNRSVAILQASRGPDGVFIGGGLRWQF